MIAALLASTAFGAVLTVNTTADLGVGSLRQHLLDALPGDGIIFDVAVFPANTVTCILLDTALPRLDQADVILEGGQRACIRPRVSLPSANGLEVTADGVAVLGMTVEDFGRIGILVNNAANVVIGVYAGPGNTVTGSGWDGIVVSGRQDLAHDNFVFFNEVNGSCTAPQPTASCGGITVRPGSGGAPAAVEITGNTVLETLAPNNPDSQGAGILLGGGSDALVLDNFIGLLGQGNAGHGIVVAAPQTFFTTNPIVTGNVVVGSGRNGIVLGIRSQDAIVTDNWVGVGGNGSQEIPNAGVGIQVFSSVGHTIGAEGLPNVISANGRQGIEIIGFPSAQIPVLVNISVGFNIIGLGHLGNNAKPNGLGGIRIASAIDWEIVGNTVSGNSGAGIEVSSGTTCDLLDNQIGTNLNGTLAVANTGDGMRLGVTDCTVSGNLVSGNGEDGIVLGGDSILVERNRVGVESEADDDLGNVGDGIRLTGATNVDLLFNVVDYNGGAGIRVGGVGNSYVLLGANVVAHNALAGVDAVQTQPLTLYKFTKNQVTDNGRCAYEFDPANLPVLVPPAVTWWGPNRAEGTYTPLVSTYTVEVFSDEGTEARRYLGDAVLDAAAGTWQLDLGPGMPRIPSTGRVSAIYVGDESSSSLAAHCEDGCATTGTCVDGNDCTLDSCVAGACGHIPYALAVPCDDRQVCSLSSSCSGGACEADPQVVVVAGPCEDGDACTTGERCELDGSCGGDPKINDCKVGDGADLPPCWGYPDVDGDEPSCDPTLGCGEPAFRPAGDACHDADHCTLGDTCDDLGSCVAGTTPAVCPDTDCNTCECDPVVGCVCSAITMDGFCSVDDWAEDRLVCGADDDHDGFPNNWELNGLDGNCDGDLDDPEDLPASFFNSAIAGLLPVYLEIDWMVADDHDHDPNGTLEDMRVKYEDFGALDLLIDYSEALDHHEAIEFTDDDNPTLLRTEDYIWYSEIKAAHFAPERRGVYAYAVMAHRLREDTAGVPGGLGEVLGDDLVVTVGNDLGDQPSTLLHEKGHNLGLTHGGDLEDGGRLNYEPNYQSRMNYFYAGGLTPVDDTGIEVFDYSHEVLYDLDEAALHEFNVTTIGDPVLGANTESLAYPHYRFKWFCPDGSPMDEDPSAVWVDFDCSGTGSLFGTVAVDLDLDGRTDEVMTGFRDWGLDALGEGGITLNFQQSDSFTPGYIATEADGEPPELAALGLLGTRHPRISVLPGCVGDVALPITAGRRVTAVIHGNLRLDVGLVDPARTWVGGAVPMSSQLRDFDQDGFLDLVTEHRADDLTLHPEAVVAHIGAFTTDGMQVIRTVTASFAEVDPDGDGDGIHDSCDACPGVGSAPNGPDGCPW